MAIHPARVSSLNDREVRPGDWVLYWMQQSQRPHDNPALEHAIRKANGLDLPVLAVFGLTDGYPEANLRHYRFMLEGLSETRAALEKRRIRLVARKGDPPGVALSFARRAAMVVCDVGYTRHQRRWRTAVAEGAPCRVVAVEGDVVVPLTVASEKAEYAARTIRPKIHRHLEAFLEPCPRYRPKRSSLEIGEEGLDLSDVDAVLDGLDLDRSVGPVTRFFRGGPAEAKRRLRAFVEGRLANYDAHRNQPQTDDVSFMSPYLHFGQVSPVHVALRIREAGQGTGADRAAYLEELVVRRELAANFVRYTPDYDRYGALPQWARRTLADHAGDPRDHRYDREALAAGKTHDPYWNAAMAEMRETGFMHNYMRMYWGKKILEWSETPEGAFETALHLNNRYFLDGRDPNSYAGVGWVFGLHDRAWFERPVFGKIRYMAASGLERKCDIQGYLRKVEALCRRAAGAG